MSRCKVCSEVLWEKYRIIKLNSSTNICYCFERSRHWGTAKEAQQVLSGPTWAQDQIFVASRRHLWWQVGAVVCNWPWPAQTSSSPITAGLTTFFYFLWFVTLPTWKGRCPCRIGWPSRTPSHWVPLSWPPRQLLSGLKGRVPCK
jgi:hypothetical protein